jgi:ABC-2 type transport system permease protein
MTATTIAPAFRPARAAAVRGRVTFPRLLKAEWLKLATLKSTWIVLGVFAAVGLLFTVALLKLGVVAGLGGPATAAAAGAWAAESASTGAFSAAVFVLIAFAVLPASSEYRTGQIRATLTAATNRGAVLGAKTAVVVALSGVATAVMLAGGILLGWLLSPGADGRIALSATDWRVLGGTVAYAVLLAAFCHGLAWLVRSTAGGLVAGYAIFFIIPPLLYLLANYPWGVALANYWPANIGISLSATTPVETWGGHWGGIAIMAAYTAAVLGAAALSLVRRDA